MKRDTVKTNRDDHWMYTNCAGCYGNCGLAIHVVDR